MFLRKSEVSEETISVVNYSLTIHQKQIKASSITPLKVKIKQTNKHYFSAKRWKAKRKQNKKVRIQDIEEIVQKLQIISQSLRLGKVLRNNHVRFRSKKKTNDI